jgi:hypothetical protein
MRERERERERERDGENERKRKKVKERTTNYSLDSCTLQTPHVALHCIVALLYISGWMVVLRILLPILAKSRFYITHCECCE